MLKHEINITICLDIYAAGHLRRRKTEENGVHYQRVILPFKMSRDALSNKDRRCCLRWPLTVLFSDLVSTKYSVCDTD